MRRLLERCQLLYSLPLAPVGPTSSIASTAATIMSPPVPLRESSPKDVIFDESHPIDMDNNTSDDLELRGLLSGQNAKNADRRKLAYEKLNQWLETGREWSRKRVVILALVFATLLLGATISRPLLGLSPVQCKSHPNTHFTGDSLRSNGTHDYKRTVLLVSIDGLRYVGVSLVARNGC